MPQNFQSTYANFETKVRFSWYSKEPFFVKMYSYTLTQYTSSVYAELIVIIDEKKFKEFKNIDKFSIPQRNIQVWFEPELKHKKLNRNFPSGPFNYCVVQYEIMNTPVTEHDLIYSNYNSAKVVRLMCVDLAFYKMTQNDRMESYGKVEISKIINKIVSRNGGKMKLNINTDYPFYWLQTQMTDYEMIRSLLPYARSSSKELNYVFFLYNNEAYFSPIGYNRKAPIRIKADTVKSWFDQYESSDLKLLIEKFGDKNQMYSTHHGFENFENVKPTKMGMEAYSSNNKNQRKQHAGETNTIFVNTGIEDKTLQEIYVSNLRQRIHTFSRLLSFKSDPIPGITPAHCLEIISETGKGEVKELDGIYYVMSITYEFGMTNTYPFAPVMQLHLCTETDSVGKESPEGKPIA